jgi:EVE domain
LLKNRNLDENYELILCANVIPKERKTFLETIGIDCKELGVTIITDMAKKFDYAFIDDKSSYDISLNELKVVLPLNEYEISDNEDPTVWIFQGNPDRYDVLNALSDKEIGNSIHWLVNQHKQKIKKGHIALIWMSGKEAGIYAIARIETDPRQLAEFPAEKKYWTGNEERDVANGVRLTVIRRLINNPILKEKLLKIPRLSQLSILRQFQGTNFPVKESEWQIISQLT